VFAQAVGSLAELAQLVVTHAHAPGEPHDLSAPAIPIGGERRELALSLGESLGSGESTARCSSTWPVYASSRHLSSSLRRSSSKSRARTLWTKRAT